MIQYIVECIAFQLLFLVVYDLFLKKETFFQWNRVYLILSYALSLVLPWIKIAALKASLPEEFIYPDYLWERDMPEIIVSETEVSDFWNISLENGILYGGMLIAILIFGYKVYKIQALRAKGEVQFFDAFTKVLVKQSTIAFSFFKTIFMGDQIREKDYENILKHELVHIRQRHSYDLLFFEVMRIIGWFNPLVYLYQNRISDLHEFIADSKVAKTNKKEQYQLLLSQVFQTENISFVNQFFKTSLIKKRIVMLQKQKSKKSQKFKYLLLVPVIVGMLFYTSIAHGEGTSTNTETSNPEDTALISKINKEIDEELDEVGSMEKVSRNFANRVNKKNEEYIFSKYEYFKFRIVNSKMSKNVRFGDDVKKDYKPRKQTLPSTSEYEFYVNRKKAFQILDKNLDISIPIKTHDAVLVEKARNYSKESYVYKVANIKDLSGAEVRVFNKKVEEIFAQESQHKDMVITDGENAIRVFRKVNTQILQQEMKDKVPFAIVDKVPVFPGCENAVDKRACFQEKMQEHISKHFKYPLKAQELGIQGRVSILFTISNEGVIQDIRKRGPHESLETEAERIISKLPKMKPGIHKGENVSVAYSMPITFKLKPTSEIYKKSSGIEVKDNTFKLKMDNPALILVDGVETIKKEMENIDTDVIESINVLKDEAATKKNGDKGKNGVIEITLKK
ncbi:TonB family protein [Maribacter vaceletii]|uniref:TonB family protein n=1 Tax=Maribacter vaceletii TaxID=1206816 RepID=A0A495EBE3_9FLAO|nr:M56 family metallopeptidase [Maribacter vaceletii]RKR14208.1 TonB family protein [Maribacter vaceletii]